MSDRIAFLAVYMPIIRQATSAYAQLWNSHKIRAQKDRPSAVVGKPMVLYNWKDDVERYGEQPSQEIVDGLTADFASWGK